jgi:hypothetical protein
MRYQGKRTAEAVASAVSPDNTKTLPGLHIETKFVENNVVTTIRCEEKLHSFIATIDDLLFCISIAENVLKPLRRSF